MKCLMFGVRRILYPYHDKEKGFIVLTSFDADLLPPIITTMPTVTTVNISWSQPDDSLPAIQYEVLLSRVTGVRQLLCDSVIDDRPIVVTTSNSSIEFINIHEFSLYVVIVVVTLPDYGINSTGEFTTLSGGRLIHNGSYINIIITVYSTLRNTT